MTPEQEIALYTSLATVLLIFIKDIIINKVTERNRKKDSILKLYKAYADPILNATQSLFWRMYELFYKKGRGVYLCPDAPNTAFNQYKKISTIYRLAALLGWFRAYMKELSYLPVDDDKKMYSLEKAIDMVRNVLASGLDVEKQRVEAILRTLGLNIPKESDLLEKTCVCVENSLRKALHRTGKELPSEMEEQDKLMLCREVINTIVEIVGEEQICEEKIVYYTCDVIKSMTIIEQWIYRDYQTAIGDIMLKESGSSYRNFDVIGYGEFEKRYIDKHYFDKVWFARLSNLFEGLDVDTDKLYDARIEQLYNLTHALAILINCMIDIDSSRKCVITDNTKQAVSSVIANHET